MLGKNLIARMAQAVLSWARPVAPPDREALETALAKDYPSLFRDFKGDMRETCMAWGCECGIGWFPIIRALSSFLDGYNKQKEDSRRIVGYASFLKHWCSGHPGETTRQRRLRYVVANRGRGRHAEPWEPVYYCQIKEKYGTLRVYITGYDDVLHGALGMASTLSYHTCESCGSHADLKVSRGWIAVRCPGCIASEAVAGTTREWRDPSC